MKAMVTGAAGFIGSHVAEFLLKQGHEVLAIDDLSGGFRENVPSGASFEKRSVTSPLDDVFQRFQPNVVYHLAAYAAEGLSHHIPVFNYTNNAVGTANVLASACRQGVEHFVFTSSIAAYGHPENGEPFDEQTACHPCDPYGTAKLACEHHVRAVADYFGGPSFTIFRPHNVFGPRQNVADPYRNVVGIFMTRCLAGLPMPIFGDGSQTRSFSHIGTVARCISEAPWTPAARNETFNVGGDESMSVHDLAGHVADAMGVPLRIEWLPPRKEVQHAHCLHDRVRAVFPAAFENSIGIVPGLREMAAFVRSHPVPPATECPAAIEIDARLPLSWQKRLGRSSPRS
jgi:UDP-glucose 4-epimerase